MILLFVPSRIWPEKAYIYTVRDQVVLFLFMGKRRILLGTGGVDPIVERRGNKMP